MTCGRCNRARYCSKECQTLDWSAHKEFCNTVHKHYLSFIDRMRNHARSDGYVFRASDTQSRKEFVMEGSLSDIQTFIHEHVEDATFADYVEMPGLFCYTNKQQFQQLSVHTAGLCNVQVPDGFLLREDHSPGCEVELPAGTKVGKVGLLFDLVFFEPVDVASLTLMYDKSFGNERLSANFMVVASKTDYLVDHATKITEHAAQKLQHLRSKEAKKHLRKIQSQVEDIVGQYKLFHTLPSSYAADGQVLIALNVAESVTMPCMLGRLKMFRAKEYSSYDLADMAYFITDTRA